MVVSANIVGNNQVDMNDKLSRKLQLNILNIDYWQLDIGQIVSVEWIWLDELAVIKEDANDGKMRDEFVKIYLFYNSN